MSMRKIAYSPKGIVHFSVGAIIKKGEKYLLIDRANIPEGFACIAGHMEPGENPEQAIIREIKEESKLDARECKLLFEETLYKNICSDGIENHHWYIFECNVKGQEKNNEEAKSIGWYAPSEIKNLKLESTWQHFLKKAGII
jgi:ADP-ribose pyrophosphatase YjhB (NUDIX family)